MALVEGYAACTCTLASNDLSMYVEPVLALGTCWAVPDIWCDANKGA
jgi:hypothetical protein